MLAPEEKDALDEWYIRNASLLLDVRIIFMTVRCVFYVVASSGLQASELA